MVDQNFEQLLAKHNADYAQSESFDNWMPDDGEYMAAIDKVETGTYTDDASGETNPSWRITAMLLCDDMPDINRKKFTLGLWRKKTQFGAMKTLAKLLAPANLRNDVEKSLAVASKVLVEAQGAVVQVRIRTPKGGDRAFADVRKVISAPAAQSNGGGAEPTQTS